MKWIFPFGFLVILGNCLSLSALRSSHRTTPFSRPPVVSLSSVTPRLPSATLHQRVNTCEIRLIKTSVLFLELWSMSRPSPRRFGPFSTTSVRRMLKDSVHRTTVIANDQLAQLVSPTTNDTDYVFDEHKSRVRVLLANTPRKVFEAFCSALAHSNITSLLIEEHQVGRDIRVLASALAKLTGLHTLRLRGNLNTQTMTEFLATNTTITTLESCSLGLAPILERNSTIKKLKITASEKDTKNLSDLVNGLMKNTTLTTLKFPPLISLRPPNSLGKIGAIIKHCTNIKALDIGGVSDYEDLLTNFQELSENCSLTNFNSSYLGFFPSHSCEISVNLISKNTTLKSLRIFGFTETENLQKIENALVQNTTLTHLHFVVTRNSFSENQIIRVLSENSNISSVEFTLANFFLLKEFFTYLGTNSTVKSLRLNILGEKGRPTAGISHVVDCLENNNTITKLDIFSRYKVFGISEEFLEMLKENTNLKIVNLKLELPNTWDLNSILRSNTTLTELNTSLEFPIEQARSHLKKLIPLFSQNFSLLRMKHFGVSPLVKANRSA